MAAPFLRAPISRFGAIYFALVNIYAARIGFCSFGLSKYSFVRFAVILFSLFHIVFFYYTFQDEYFKHFETNFSRSSKRILKEYYDIIFIMFKFIRQNEL